MLPKMTANPYDTWPALAPEQRRLLRAALESNRKTAQSPTISRDSQQASPAPASIQNSLTGALDSAGVNPSFLTKMEYDNAFNGDFNVDQILDLNLPDMNTAMPDVGLDDADDEQGEKRKSPEDDDDDDDEDDYSLKRRDSDDKAAKKPGRKPVTAEPTTKRKAQNRAAQRAFRERKEKHLKDLENKVTDLEKASETANHENGLLRAQISRLQNELSDYRRRLSLSSTATRQSPTQSSPSNQTQAPGRSSIDSIDFSFDFPHFGGLPGSQLESLGKQSNINNSPASQAESTHSLSERGSITRSNTNQSPSRSNTQTNQGPKSKANSMFGSGYFNGIDNASFGFPTSSSPQQASLSSQSLAYTDNQKSGFNGSVSGSSSRSSAEPNGAQTNSSCTSPDTLANWQSDFSSHSQMGNDDGLSSGNSSAFANLAKTPGSDLVNFDWFASQNGNLFDPVLFGTYRESQDAVVGGGDFSGGLFEEALPFPDLNDSFNFNLSTDKTIPAQMPQQHAKEAPKKVNLMEQVEKQKEGDYVGVGNTTDQTPEHYSQYLEGGPGLMTCHKIWNQLQNCPRFKSGDFDVDSLCSELASKAKCTESGVQVPKAAVEAALWKLAGPTNE